MHRCTQNDQRTLRRRRALRRLVKSPAKAKLRPTGADHTGDASLCLCQHKGTILMTHRCTHALPPMLPSTLASQPCRAVPERKAQQLSSKDMVFFQSPHPCCPGSLPPLACSAVDAPFNNTLVALQASFRCSNRGPPVKMISNKLQNMVLLSAEVANASDSAGLTCTWFWPPRRRTMRVHAYKLIRLPKEE